MSAATGLKLLFINFVQALRHLLLNMTGQWFCCQLKVLMYGPMSRVKRHSIKLHMLRNEIDHSFESLLHTLWKKLFKMYAPFLQTSFL